ncbi:uncharacterized protein B0H18DRAFT_846023, partial [Fomitopsis serialis]|uniref:uncharacterized protein n=1 Tax=Fomitopsis serialis TaxID=139415 RepID=UPI002007492B
DEDIWYPDGDVVLEAQGHVFKVYQGLLALNSDVFRDLFAIAQPKAVETIDGCPVVHLHDHPIELRHLLQVLFEYYPSDEQLEFAVVAALIRLSHKYQIEWVCDAYLSRMKSCFCTDFKTWIAVYKNSGNSSMYFCGTDAIQAVNIARLTGTDSMLPSALFICCQLDPYDLLHGSPRPDGTLERLRSRDIVHCINA